MTLKNKEYIYHLWDNIYAPICTTTPPRPWPKPLTGKPIKQYTFNTKSLPSLTELHSKWYNWSEDKMKFIKVVPLNISEILTPIGLAHWIMDDGFRKYNDKGIISEIGLCTESFTIEEVIMLSEVLTFKFNLLNSLKPRRKKGREEIGYRIYISTKSSTIPTLLNLVRPFFIDTMIYKLEGKISTK